MGLFGLRRHPRPTDETRRRVEALAREAGGYAAATVVRANEIVCPDPACPGYETVILVMEAGRASRAFKIAKPLVEVAQDDVIHALRIEV